MTENTLLAEVPKEPDLEAAEVVASEIAQEEPREAKLGRTLLEEAGYSRRAIPLLRF